MLRLGISWANPYSNNLGVAALGYSSLAIIHDVCQETNTDAELVFIDYSNKKEDSIFIGQDEIKFSLFKLVDGSPAVAFLKMALNKEKYQAAATRTLDAVFDMSGGDSFTDIYGDVRFEKMLNAKRLFNRLKTPQILLPQTIGPFKQKAHEERAFAEMNKMEAVFARDKQSFDYSAPFLSSEKLSETIDVAFYLPYEKKSFAEGTTHVGINISGLLWRGGYNGKNQFGMKTDYQKLIESTIAYFSSMPDVTMHFVSHVINRNKSIEDDYSVAQMLQRKYPKAILAPSFYSPIEAKSYISGLQFFTGARMHACIAAFSSGVPLLPMAYSRKFNGLFGDTLQYKWYGDCVNETEDEVMAKLKIAFEQRNDAKAAIDYSNEHIVQPRMNKLKQQLAKTINTIKAKKEN